MFGSAGVASVRIETGAHIFVRRKVAVRKGNAEFALSSYFHFLTPFLGLSQYITKETKKKTAKLN